MQTGEKIKFENTIPAIKLVIDNVMKCVGILVGIKILAYLGEGEFVLILTN